MAGLNGLRPGQALPTARVSGLQLSICPADLETVARGERCEILLKRASDSALGSAAWRRRKSAEARSVLALAAMAPAGRLNVLAVDMTETLRLLLVRNVPVPCWDADRGLVARRRALLDVAYRQDALRAAQPGMAFVSIVRPRNVLHANVPADEGFQPLCLGTTLPPGITCVNLGITTYQALAMQSVMIDERDASGVLNAEAARWWQANRHRIPLPRTPFLAADAGEPASTVSRGVPR